VLFRSVVAGEYKISNKQIDTPRLDQKALREVHPDICKLFTKISTSTRFEIR
jgi:predicted phage-related endonuclease